MKPMNMILTTATICLMIACAKKVATVPAEPLIVEQELKCEAVAVMPAKEMKKDMAMAKGVACRSNEMMMDEMIAPAGSVAQPQFNTEEYNHIQENGYKRVTDAPLSTFSIDVDGASFSNTRRFLMNENRLPPVDAVRIEEFINYFRYDYPQPTGDQPFSITTGISSCPWNEKHKLVQIGLQGKKIDLRQAAPSNLVFLLDVSGSMDEPNKLPLLKKSLSLLVDEMRPSDRIAIVVYAGAAGLVLPSTPASEKRTILGSLDNLQREDQLRERRESNWRTKPQKRISLPAGTIA